MSTRLRNVLILAAILGLAAAAFTITRPPRGVGSETVANDPLLGAVPRDAWLVITIDLDALRTSPLSRPVLGGGTAAEELLGAGQFVELCGFDPLARVHGLVIAAPEAGEHGEFGVAATGDLKQADFVACARKAIESRGGTANVTKHGSFSFVEDTSAAPAGGNGHAPPRIAIRDGGPLLVGRGTWLEAMADAAEGRGARVTDGTPHALLRNDLLAKSATAKRAPAVVLSAILPRSLRDRLKSEMGTESTGEGAAEGDGGGANAMMSGVLGVETAGLAITAGGAGEESSAAMELRCESPAACTEVKQFLEKERLALSQSFTVRLLGVGALLDGLTIAVDGAKLNASTRAPTDALASAIERALKFRGAGRSAGAGSGGSDTGTTGSATGVGTSVIQDSGGESLRPRPHGDAGRSASKDAGRGGSR